METGRPPQVPDAPEQTAPLDVKLGFLARPDTYPEEPSHVEAVETHMSWVFLTDTHAYKLKKPVRYAYLDFSTAEARRLDCELEVRLNLAIARQVPGLTRDQRDHALDLAVFLHQRPDRQHRDQPLSCT